MAVLKQRKISDKEVFDKTMIRAPFLFYYHILRGDWNEYKKRVRTKLPLSIF